MEYTESKHQYFFLDWPRFFPTKAGFCLTKQSACDHHVILLNTNEKLAVFGFQQAGLFQIAKHNLLTVHRVNLSHRHQTINLIGTTETLRILISSVKTEECF